MSTLIFGAGYLGTRIAREWDYQIAPREEADPLNLSDLKSFLDKQKPEVVINAIGKTGRPNIDWCEAHKEETLQGNLCAAVNLATECSQRGIYFVHLGSGCIYAGDNNGKGFTEEDEPNFYGPQFYAKTKILAEKAIKELGGLILRIRMPIDDRPHERNLIDKLIKYPRVIMIPNSMTTVPHMIPALKVLIDKRAGGIYNFTNPKAITAARIMNMYRDMVDSGHEYETMKLAELDKITTAKRSNCILNTDKLQRELQGSGIEMPEIHDAVRECLVKYQESIKKK